MASCEEPRVKPKANAKLLCKDLLAKHQLRIWGLLHRFPKDSYYCLVPKLPRLVIILSHHGKGILERGMKFPKLSR